MDANSTEFIAEAQEVIETFSRNLLELEAQSRSGSTDPDILNAAFRAVHSLKGLAGLFGATGIGGLSHALEETLDALRLGKIELSRDVLDVLFEGVELFGRLLDPKDHEHAEQALLPAFLERLAVITKPKAPVGEVKDNLDWIDEGIRVQLSEYEEHRLRENLRKGRSLYRIHAAFDILAIDVGIEALKEKLKAHGEVITYLPSVDGFSDDSIELDILFGSSSGYSEVSSLLADEEKVSVHKLQPGGASEPAAVVVTPTAAPEPVMPITPVEPAVTPSPSGDGGGIIEPPEPPSPEEPRSGGGGGGSGNSGGVDVSLRSLSQTVRVDLRRLDVLMNLVGELGVVQANLQSVFSDVRQLGGAADVSRELQIQIRDMERKLALLQQGILDVRMVPIEQVFDKLARVVRKLSRQLDKEIRLNISGRETVLDKLIVEELSDPLMHMIRNCMDHGIEQPDERVAAGKPRAGKVDLRAFQKGNRVVIEVEDDGGGIDWRRIREVGIERGVISNDDAAGMSQQEIINLIFAPGFSTRAQASEVSGRGVGMDVVRTNIAKLSGMIEVTTEVGRGTRFSITLPVTLAIIQALVIQSSGHTFCIPLNSVLESIMVETREIATVEGHEVITLRERTLPLVPLAQLFNLPVPRETRALQRVYVVVVGLAQHRVGLVVDELLGQQDVVIKPLGSALRNIPGIAGATELGANRTVLLLDVGRLVDEGIHQAESSGFAPDAPRGRARARKEYAGPGRQVT